MTPVVTVSDNSILCDGEFSIWVTVPADLVDDFVESLRKLNKIALKNRLVYIFIYIYTCWLNYLFDVLNCSYSNTDTSADNFMSLLL